MTQQEAYRFINCAKVNVFALRVCKANGWVLSFEKSTFGALMAYETEKLLEYVQASRDVQVAEECCKIDREVLYSYRGALPEYSALQAVKWLKAIHDFVLTEVYGISDEDSELYFIDPDSGKCINLITKTIIPRLGGDAAQIMRGATDATERVNEKSCEKGLPLNMDTPRARIAFSRAIARGWIKKTRGGYKWVFEYGCAPRPTFAYFVTRVYKDDKRARVPSKELERMFGIKGVSRAVYQVFGGKQWWRGYIDRIFKDL